MSTSDKKLEVSFERDIPAPADKVYDAWLSAKVPGTPWHLAGKLLLQPKVDGFFYWTHGDNAHYGRFTKMDRPRRIRYTWMSQSTLGEETLVTVTFRRKAAGTHMKLVHSGLPNARAVRGHTRGWTYFLDIFPGSLGAAARGRG